MKFSGVWGPLAQNLKLNGIFSGCTKMTKWDFISRTEGVHYSAWDLGEILSLTLLLPLHVPMSLWIS